MTKVRIVVHWINSTEQLFLRRCPAARRGGSCCTTVQWKPGHWLLVQICGADRSEGRLIGHPAPGLWTAADMWTSSSNIPPHKVGYWCKYWCPCVHLVIIWSGHHPRTRRPLEWGSGSWPICLSAPIAIPASIIYKHKWVWPNKSLAASRYQKLSRL